MLLIRRGVAASTTSAFGGTRILLQHAGGQADFMSLLCRRPVAAMHRAGAKARASPCADALPVYDHANKTTGFNGRYNKTRGGIISCVFAT
jgi:hypothetical protein